MSETIKPALTPEEWAVKRFWTDADHIGAEVSVGADGVVVIRDNDYYTGFTAYATRPHAVAALALHQQPFGFDRLDAAGLREMANVHAEDNDELGALAKSMFDLAARIEALLPPEGP